MNDASPFPVASSQRVFSGVLINLRVDELALPNGRRGRREVVEHPGGVTIVPLRDDGRLLLVRQYRHPTGRALLEFPAGGLDPGEEPLACAARELQEEVGYRAERLEKLGGFFLAPGYDTEYQHAFLAEGLTPVEMRPDDDEVIEVAPLTASQLVEAAESGGIEDAKTLAALFLLWRRRPELFD
ncbi:MAG TPA: NUDIX hydrolase [Dehalococcoidia bacterium]|nr:NUDIX hydrolase [Dehalococcoidia bacterium]